MACRDVAPHRLNEERLGERASRCAWTLILVVVTAFVPQLARSEESRVFTSGSDELGRIKLILAGATIPIGCSYPNCCPGCDVQAPLTIRARLSGEAVSSIDLLIEPSAGAGLPAPGVDSTQTRLRLDRTGEAELTLPPGTASAPNAWLLRIDGPSVLGAVHGGRYDRSDSRVAALPYFRLDIDQWLGRWLLNRWRLWIDRHGDSGFGFVPADRIQLSGKQAADEAIVLVDGRDGPSPGQCVNDWVRRTTSSVNVGNLLGSVGCNAETAVFACGNAMALEGSQTIWTDSSGDLQSIALAPRVALPVHAWVLPQGDSAAPCGCSGIVDPIEAAECEGYLGSLGLDPDFCDTLSDLSRIRCDALVVRLGNPWCYIRAAMAMADAWLDDNRTGIALAVTEHDLGSVPGDPVGTSCDDVPYLHASGFPYYEAGALNVYLVREATSGSEGEPSVSTGVACTPYDSNVIYIMAGVLGVNVGHLSTVVHELGHSLSLHHPRGFTLARNLMGGGKDADRDRFTIGQAVRMNLDCQSRVNANGVRIGPTRACDHYRATSGCPGLDLDWAHDEPCPSPP